MRKRLRVFAADRGRLGVHVKPFEFLAGRFRGYGGPVTVRIVVTPVRGWGGGGGGRGGPALSRQIVDEPEGANFIFAF